jgi:hypothetical protein
LLRIALDVDVRRVLPSISAPRLILHRGEDVFSSVEHARYLADHLPDATYVELGGQDHPFFIGDADEVLDAIEQFVTGRAPAPHHDRVLATTLFVDMSGQPTARSPSGTGDGATCSNRITRWSDAARVAALAEPSEVLVSRTVKDRVAGSGIRFADRGIRALKGIPESWQLYSADA